MHTHMEGVLGESHGPSVTLDGVDNVVQHVKDQVVQSVHEVSTLPPSIVSESIVSTTLEPVASSAASEVITEAASSLATEVTTHASTIIDHVESSTSTIVENIVQPVIEEFQPVQQEIIQEVPKFVEPEIVTETVTEHVTEYITEATQELTTLISNDNVATDEDASDKIASRLSPKALLTHEYVQWLHETRLILAISISMVYLFIIFFIRRLLSKRSPFHLRNLLTLWNLSLATFSIACSVILSRSLIPLVKDNGLGVTICSAPISDSIRCWLNLFTWSKLLELGNTLFVVLRKQKLRFIHVYFHLSTLIYTFYLFGGGIIASGDNVSTPGYYPVIVLINVTVQGIIYTYYTFRSRGFAPPKLLTMILNLIHIIQFIVILFILSLSLYHHLSPSDPIISTLSSIPIPSSLSKLTLPPSIKSLATLTTNCSPSMSIDIFGITLIGTNFIFFVNHFRSNYVKPKTIKLL